MEVSKHTGGIQTYWGVQTYGTSKHTGVHPNIWGIQMYGVYGHPLSLIKHAFFVLCMYRGHPNIIQNMGAVQIYRAVQHTGGIQTYGAVQIYREAFKCVGCPNIQGAIQTSNASKHMGHLKKKTGGIQTHGVIPTYGGH